MTTTDPGESSPKWGPMTKMVVGLSFVGVVAALLYRFRSIIGPLILAFVLSYLLYPVADGFHKTVRVSWRTAVNIIFLVVIVLLSGLITVAGFAIVQQVQSLVIFVQRFVAQLPALAATLSTQVYTIGPFKINFSQFDLTTLTNQLLSVVQPLLGQLGILLRSFAGSAAGTLGWLLFVLLIAYFLLADARRFPNRVSNLDLPGYNTDLQRLSEALRQIWNTFLRGQLFITILVMMAYSVIMFVLGLRYAIGIAILAGLSRFIPYVGPFTTLMVTFLVAFLQGGNYFGLDPLQYALLAVAVSLIFDQAFDNIVSPRFLGSTLGVHPAAVLVAAIVAANLIGLIGLILAAPVLATLRVLARYVLRKMFDQDPWLEYDEPIQSAELPWTRWGKLLREWRRALMERLKRPEGK